MSTKALAGLSLRPMTAQDLARAEDLSRDHQWPHREEDWAFFLSIGEGLVAERDGLVIGTIMAWRFGPRVATLGMVIVDKAAQGQGIGRALMEAMLARLEGMSVVLNATAEGLPLYRKLGFAEIGCIHQHQGPAPVVPLAALRPDERVRPMGPADADIADLYSRASGMDRTALVAALMARDKGVVLTRDHVPVGFAMLRRFGRGWSIAPVIAPDADGAKVLILHGLAQHTGTFCRLDVSDESGLSPWLAELGLPRVGGGIKMVRGPAPVEDTAFHVFGLTTQALT